MLKQNELLKFYRTAQEIENRTSCLTVKDCMREWGYATPSAARYTMNLMVNAGLLRKIPRGRYFIYRTVERQD